MMNRAQVVGVIAEYHRPIEVIDKHPSYADTSKDSSKAPLSPGKQPIPPQLLRTIIQARKSPPRIGQQYIRSEHGDDKVFVDPITTKSTQVLDTQTIDFRLKGNDIRIGGCWGTVKLSEAVDFKPRSRSEFVPIPYIVQPKLDIGLPRERQIFVPLNEDTTYRQESAVPDPYGIGKHVV
jgi:hypothetical protein